MIIASKGAAGVTGAGLATLAGGLSSHRPELLDGVGLIVGIDRFMSEARALTNFAGNAVATVLIGTWTGGLDRAQLDAVLAGQRPFDETTMLDAAEAADGRPGHLGRGGSDHEGAPAGALGSGCAPHTARPPPPRPLRPPRDVGADGLRPGGQRLRRLPRPAHPARPALARRRGVGLPRGRPAGRRPATPAPTWCRCRPRPTRWPPSPSGPLRRQRRCATIVGPPRRSSRCGSGSRRTGARPRECAGDQPHLEIAAAPPVPPTRWYAVRRRATSTRSTRPAWRCTPRRSASPRRSAAARTSTGPGSRSWSPRAGRSPGSRTAGWCSRPRSPPPRRTPARSRASTSTPSAAARAWPPPGWPPSSQPCAARHRAGGLALRQRAQPGRPRGLRPGRLRADRHLLHDHVLTEVLAETWPSVCSGQRWGGCSHRGEHHSRRSRTCIKLASARRGRARPVVVGRSRRSPARTAHRPPRSRHHEQPRPGREAAGPPRRLQAPRGDLRGEPLLRQPVRRLGSGQRPARRRARHATRRTRPRSTRTATPYACLLQNDVNLDHARRCRRLHRRHDAPTASPPATSPTSRSRSTTTSRRRHDLPGARRRSRANGVPKGSRRSRAAAPATSCTASTRSSTSSTAAGRTATRPAPTRSA